MARHKPALLGGLFIGVLSALPGVSAGNCCCCLWVVLGGMLTVYLQQQRVQTPIETSEAVLGGVFAGVVGAVLALLLSLLFLAILGPYQNMLMAWLVERMQNMPNLPEETRAQFATMLDQAPEATFFGIVVNFAIGLPINAIFAMLGALLGLAFFRKKITPDPTMPPLA